LTARHRVVHRAPVHADGVRVELATPDALASGAERAACEGVLSANERERAARIRGAGARDAFVLAHALARHALARAAGVAAGEIALTTGPRGKPEITGPLAARAIRFNLSHTEGLAACALVRDAAIGVDVETRDRRVDPLPLAARFFAPAETAALRTLDTEPRREAFLRLWTSKEALLKAIGVGIAGGLASVAFDLATDPPRLLPGPLAGDPERWQLAHLAPTPHHILALAVERSGGADRAVTIATLARITAPSS
jgi:4'-phosphopantetheinyl transferase